MQEIESEEQSQLQQLEREDDEMSELEDGDEILELGVTENLTLFYGINYEDVTKLGNAGIKTCKDVLRRTKKDLTAIEGLSEAKVDQIWEAAEKIANFGLNAGRYALLTREDVVRITTGSQALDELLGGGIATLQITEALGKFRSGKTQLAHTLCVTTQLPTNMKGGKGKVFYIDTEGTFYSKPDLIVPIAQRFGMDAGAVLDNIIHESAHTYEEVENLLLGFAAKMPIKLLITEGGVEDAKD